LAEVDRDALFELATYLVASARDCLDEPPAYGPLRLLVAVDKIIEMGESRPLLRDEFLARLKGRIGRDILSVMSDRRAFAKALDDLSVEFAKEFKRRKGDR